MLADSTEEMHDFIRDSFPAEEYTVAAAMKSIWKSSSFSNDKGAAPVKVIDDQLVDRHSKSIDHIRKFLVRS